MKYGYIYIMLLLGILTVGLFTSCSSSKETLPITAATPAIGPSDILAKSRDAMSLVKSYRFDLSHRNGNGSKIDESLTLVTAVGSVNRGEGISLESELLFGNIPVSAGVIKTKKSIYLRDPLSQKWRLIPEDSNPFAFLDPDKIITSVITGIYEPNLVSSKGDVFKISGQISTSSLDYIFQETVNKDIDVTVWINRKSFVITRAEIAGRISEVDSDEIIRVIKITRYDEVLEIATPEIK
jgi:hypothetical protein